VNRLASAVDAEPSWEEHGEVEAPG
jgi:hypothetical protein